MYCSKCGHLLAEDASFCGGCGTRIPALGIRAEASGSPAAHPATMRKAVEVGDSNQEQKTVTQARTIVVAALGLILGGTIGFLMRPSAFLVGQLPFETVITRGATLNGLDQMLAPLAQQSFNYLIGGAVTGSLLGLLVGFLIYHDK